MFFFYFQFGLLNDRLFGFGLLCVSLVNVYQSVCYLFPLGFEEGMGI